MDDELGAHALGGFLELEDNCSEYVGFPSNLSLTRLQFGPIISKPYESVSILEQNHAAG